MERLRAAKIRAVAVVGSALGAALAGCGTAPVTPGLALALGHQRELALGGCALLDDAPRALVFRCEAGSLGAVAPIVGFAVFLAWLGYRVGFHRGGYQRTTQGVLLGLCAYGLVAALGYVAYDTMQAHTHSLDLAAQSYTHEARVAGALVARDEAPLRALRCSVQYVPSTKNTRSGWKVLLTAPPHAPRSVGRLRFERDAQAVCSYLQPLLTGGPPPAPSPTSSAPTAAPPRGDGP